MGLRSRLEIIFEKLGWYPKGASSKEKQLLFKLDSMILVYTSLSFFTKFLDVSALNNAYVSGMKEDINLQGNDLNYVNAVYESCYCVFQIPINLLLTRFPSSIILPISEFFWGIATLGTAFVHNRSQLMACRALLGLFAASNYIGCVYIIGSWYKRNERAKRMAVFFIAGPIGNAVGGWVQAAIYNKTGLPLESWRFLFIVCSLVTFVVSFYGFLALPNFPHDIRSRFLTEEEKALALERVNSEEIKTERSILNRKTFKTVFFTWQPAAFAFLMFGLVFGSYGSGTPFYLFLSSNPELTVQQVNNIPTAVSGLALISALASSWYSDIYDDRAGPMILNSVVAIISNGILVNYSTSEAGKYYAFISMGWSYGIGPIWQAWISDATSHSSELRAYAIAASNVTGEVGALVVPLVVFKVTQAPKYTAGFIFSLIISVSQILVSLLILYLSKKYPGQVKKEEEDVSSINTSSRVENADESDKKDASISIVSVNEKVN